MHEHKHHLDDLFAARARDVSPPMYGPTPPRHSDMISFSYGLADPALFPRADLLAATDAVLKEDAAAARNYGPSFSGPGAQVVARLRSQGRVAEADTLRLG